MGGIETAGVLAQDRRDAHREVCLLDSSIRLANPEIHTTVEHFEAR
jgi:hypothetical protein